MNIPKRASYSHPRCSAKPSLDTAVFSRLVLAPAEPGEGKPLHQVLLQDDHQYDRRQHRQDATSHHVAPITSVLALELRKAEVERVQARALRND